MYLLVVLRGLILRLIFILSFFLSLFFKCLVVMNFLFFLMNGELFIKKFIERVGFFIFIIFIGSGLFKLYIVLFIDILGILVIIIIFLLVVLLILICFKFLYIESFDIFFLDIIEFFLYIVICVLFLRVFL